MTTSSTAQGGGGSFKNRKPIGEVGCCESGMAERVHWWTERCLRSPLFCSLSLTIYLPTYLSSMYLSIYRSISLSLLSSVSLSSCLPVHFDLEMCFAPQRCALFRHPNLQKWREHVVFRTFWLGNVLRATAARTFSTSEPLKVARTCVFCAFWLGNVLRATTACTFSTSEPPKVARTCAVLYILTWKCASRHNGVHFFDISTSKSGPDLVCFAHFDFKMCFAPQRRAIFHHSSGQLAPHPPL